MGVLVYERQDKEYSSKMKHVSGDLNRWSTIFEDQIEISETVGVNLSESITL